MALRRHAGTRDTAPAHGQQRHATAARSYRTDSNVDSGGRAFYQLGELPFDRLAEAAPAALPRQLAEDAEEEWDDDSDSESDSYEVCVSMVEIAAPEAAELASRGSERPRAPEQSRARAAWGAPAVQLWSLSSLSEAPRGAARHLDFAAVYVRYYRGGRGPSLT